MQNDNDTNALEHLSEEEISQLMSRYYSGEKVKSLMQEFKIEGVQSGSLYKLFPDIEQEERCPYCDVPMYSKAVSKTEYSSRYRLKQSKVCKLCQHTIAYDRWNDKPLQCQCKDCTKLLELRREEKRREGERRRNRIQEIIADTRPKAKKFETLTIKEKIYLGALLRANIAEDNRHLKPLYQSTDKLAPTEEYTTKIARYLYDQELIYFSPDHLDGITLIDDKRFSWSLSYCSFSINLTSESYSIAEILELLQYPEMIDSKDVLEAYEVWTEIAFYEGLEYLYKKLDYFELPSEYIGDKSKQSLLKALESCSVSELFNHIWSAVKNAAAQNQRKEINRRHAVNMIAGSITRRVERALSDGWDIKGYHRDYELPQSIISELMGNRLLRVGEKVFTERMSVDFLEDHVLAQFDMPTI